MNDSNIKYKAFDEGEWSSFGDLLLSKSNIKEQKRFLKACVTKKDFLNYIESKLTFEGNDGDNEPPLIEDIMTEREFRFPPESRQQSIWELFHQVPAYYLTNEYFWGYVVVNLIKNDIIEPSFLASQMNGQDITGESYIASLLQDGNNKEIDTCVRRVLRSMAHSKPRGSVTRTLFVDFYIGFAFWRQEMLRVIGRNSNDKLSVIDVSNILREDLYRSVAELASKKNTYCADPNILVGLCLYVKGYNDGKDSKKHLKQGDIFKLLRQMGVITAWQSVSLMSHDEIAQIFTDISQAKV